MVTAPGTALLVGGGRFVGRRLLDRLLREGLRVDVLNRGRTAHPATLPRGVRHFPADRGDAPAVRRAVGGRKFDYVFDTSGYRPEEVRNVLDAVDCRRYVFVSTLMVYSAIATPSQTGGAGVGLRENDETVPAYHGDDESDDRYPGRKRACERVLLDQDRVAATILRPCGIYGPGDYWYRHDYFFDRVARNRPVLIPRTHLDRTVHFTAVDSLADAGVLAAHDDHPGHRVFNVADREPVTYRALAELCFEAAGTTHRILAYDAATNEPALSAAGQRARFPFGAEPGFSLNCHALRTELAWPAPDLRAGTAALYRDFTARHTAGTTDPPDFSLDDALLRAGATSPVYTG